MKHLNALFCIILQVFKYCFIDISLNALNYVDEDGVINCLGADNKSGNEFAIDNVLTFSKVY